EAVERVMESAFSKEELLSYDRYWDSIRSERTLIGDAHREGREAGRAEGRLEGKLEVAAALKRAGRLSVVEIAEISGLSPEQVAEL
ncbi:MAG: hypothetical protein MUF04_04745, partial [Akkermansiaceae bacterium]|nr:hypothetical protein [Akkermansiaceae bacterium]